MTRRVLLVLAALPVWGGSEEVLDTLTSIASALSEGNAAAFLKPFDREMKGFDTMAADVSALVVQAEVVCTIEILMETGDDRGRTVQLDWFLQAKSKAENGALERRRQIVEARFEKVGKKWKIAAFDPQSILAPMKLG